MDRIGIVAALPEEADAFLPGKGGRAGVVRSVDAGRHAFFIATSGIGKVNATIAATRLIVEHRVEMLVAIGTAGALGARHGTFRIVEAIQWDYGAARTDGFMTYSAGAWPIGLPELVPFEAHPHDSPLATARIATGDAFAEHPELAERLKTALGCDLVDMEVGAIAQVAAAFKIPWAAVKATTDSADGDSAGNFSANLTRAAKEAAQAAEALLGV